MKTRVYGFKPGQRFQMYIRSVDLKLWEWAKKEARTRRMKISQFVMLCIENEKKRG